MNNLDLLIPHAADKPDAWLWATITAVNPLRIRLDGDDVSLDLTPEYLFPGEPPLGERVWVQVNGRRVIVHGPTKGVDFTPAIEDAEFRAINQAGLNAEQLLAIESERIDDDIAALAARADEIDLTVGVFDDDLAAIDLKADSAINAANGKNTINHSTNAPGSAANVAGDVWFRYDENNVIIGQWEGRGGTTWVSKTIGSQTIANLDVGKLSGGFVDVQHIDTKSLLVGGSTLGATLDGKETPSGAQSKADAAKQAAITAAATDAQNKASAAESAAKTAAAADAASKAAAAEAAAKAAAAADAKAKADAAQAAAISASSTDAKAKADAAEAAAKTAAAADAASKAATAEANAKAAAATDAQSKADAAKAAAISAAATDATTKANAARSNAVADLKNMWGYPTNSTLIDGGNIYTRSIKAQSMAMGDFTNFIADGDLKDATFDQWTGGGLSRVAPAGEPAYMTWSSYSSGNAHMYNTHRFPCANGDEFYFVAEVSTPSTNTTSVNIQPCIQTYNAQGTTTNWAQFTRTIAPNTGWTEIEGTIRVTNAATVEGVFDPFLNSVGGVAGQQIRMRRMRLFRRNGAELIVDGAITAVQLDAKAITSKHTITGPLFQTREETNRGIKIVSSANSTYGSLVCYDDTGNATFTLNGQTGSITMKGSLSGGSYLETIATNGSKAILQAGSLQMFSNVSGEVATGGLTAGSWTWNGVPAAKTEITSPRISGNAAARVTMWQGNNGQPGVELWAGTNARLAVDNTGQVIRGEANVVHFAGNGLVRNTEIKMQTNKLVLDVPDTGIWIGNKAVNLANNIDYRWRDFVHPEGAGAYAPGTGWTTIYYKTWIPWPAGAATAHVSVTCKAYTDVSSATAVYFDLIHWNNGRQGAQETVASGYSHNKGNNLGDMSAHLDGWITAPNRGNSGQSFHLAVNARTEGGSWTGFQPSMWNITFFS